MMSVLLLFLSILIPNVVNYCCDLCFLICCCIINPKIQSTFALSSSIALPLSVQTALLVFTDGSKVNESVGASVEIFAIQMATELLYVLAYNGKENTSMLIVKQPLGL